MAAFYETKGWYKSKTVWTGIVTALLGLAGLFGFVLPVDPVTTVNTGYAAVTTLLGLLTVVFRTKATAAIGATPAVV
jgi:uncharacterized membrane protein